MSYLNERWLLKMGLKEKEVKEPYKGPRNQSKKRQKDQRKYRNIIKKMADQDNTCEIKSPVCLGLMSGANHKQKRSPKNLLDVKNLERSCDPCNNFVELNPKWAAENGHQISRFAPSVLIAEKKDDIILIDRA